MQNNQQPTTEPVTANGIKVYSTATPPEPMPSLNNWTNYIHQEASKKN